MVTDKPKPIDYCNFFLFLVVIRFRTWWLLMQPCARCSAPLRDSLLCVRNFSEFHICLWFYLIAVLFGGRPFCRFPSIFPWPKNFGYCFRLVWLVVSVHLCLYVILLLLNCLFFSLTIEFSASYNNRSPRKALFVCSVIVVRCPLPGLPGDDRTSAYLGFEIYLPSSGTPLSESTVALLIIHSPYMLKINGQITPLPSWNGSDNFPAILTSAFLLVYSARIRVRWPGTAILCKIFHRWFQFDDIDWERFGAIEKIKHTGNVKILDFFYNLP